MNLLEKDHRVLGQEMDLFHFEEHSPGMPFYHPNGFRLFNIIENYIRMKLEDYQEVRTPIMLDKSLWEKSGHWEKFKEHIFIALDDDNIFVGKREIDKGMVSLKNNFKSFQEEIRLADINDVIGSLVQHG